MADVNLDQWLRDNLVCPRDHKPLTWHDDRLTCADGHAYPLIDGLPVMIVEEVEANHPMRFANTREQVTDVKARPEDDKPLPEGQIDPYVREILANTCGMLYGPIKDKFMRYPIPDIRLPESDGGIFLDLGCSWGRWSNAAAKKGYKPIGIEPSIDRVRAARRVAKQLGNDARFLVGDARHMPFKDQCFDVVYSHIVLQHFSKENAKITLGEVRRVLKPDGQSMIQMATKWGIRNQFNQLRWHIRHLYRPRNPFRIRYWSTPELRRTYEELVGPTTMSADSYFSVNAQTADIDLLYKRHQMVVKVSDAFRRASENRPWLIRCADSVFMHSKPKQDG